MGLEVRSAANRLTPEGRFGDQSPKEDQGCMTGLMVELKG